MLFLTPTVSAVGVSFKNSRTYGQKDGSNI
jgi:hypothetical protein